MKPHERIRDWLDTCHHWALMVASVAMAFLLSLVTLAWLHRAGSASSFIQALAAVIAACATVMLCLVTKEYTTATKAISDSALEQVRAAKQAALLPILADMFQEYRSTEFKDSLRYIRKTIPGKHDPTRGFENVTQMMSVSHFFDQMGVILQGRFVDEEVRDLVFEFMASDIIHSWELLGPVVDGERVQKNEPSCQRNFATLAEQALEWKAKKDQSLIVE